MKSQKNKIDTMDFTTIIKHYDSLESDDLKESMQNIIIEESEATEENRNLVDTILLLYNPIVVISLEGSCFGSASYLDLIIDELNKNLESQKI